MSFRVVGELGGLATAYVPRPAGTSATTRGEGAGNYAATLRGGSSPASSRASSVRERSPSLR